MPTGVAAIIVSYFPDEGLLQLVKDLVSQVAHIFVIDNGSGDNPALNKVQELEPVIIMRLQKNMGIAYALNRGIEQAHQRNCSFIITLDQDSRLPSRYVSDMLGFYQDCLAKGFQIGMVAPDFIDVNAKTQARFSVLKKWQHNTVTCDLASDSRVKELDVSFAITSGSIYPITVLQAMGGFREDFFIDHVDSEYCLRLINKGYKIFVNCRVQIEHSIGKRSVHKFLGLTVKPNHHKPFRRYYIARNGVRSAIDYFLSHPSYSLLTFMRLVHEFLSILLYESDKVRKLYILTLGIFHGFIGRMGELNRRA
jgi:rhamnosyltransferase